MITLDELIAQIYDKDDIDRVNEADLISEIDEMYDIMFDEIIDILLAYYGENGEDTNWNDAQKKVGAKGIAETQKRIEKLKKLKKNTDINEVKYEIQREIDKLKNRGILTKEKILVDKINEKLMIGYSESAEKIYHLIRKTYIDYYKEQYGKEPTKQEIENVMIMPHYGSNWFNRFFDNKNRLSISIKMEILKAIKGEQNIRESIKNVQKLGNMSKYQASRLVRTENCIARTEGFLDGLEKLNVVTHVIVITARDERTCSDCKDKDNTIMTIQEARVNGTPFHPLCRCTLAPYTDELMQ